MSKPVPLSLLGCASVCALFSAAAFAQPSTEAATGRAESPPTDAVLSPIEVSGHSLGATLRQRQAVTPGAVAVINGNDFHRRAVDNLAGALRYVPGVLMQSNDGADDGVLSIRGSNLTSLNYDKGGVVLLQDGLPITTADGTNHNRFPDPLAARNVVVALGANALTYGASALGGAINFISRTARNSDPRSLYLYGGSHGLFGGRASTGAVFGDWDGTLTVSRKHFDGYRQHGRQHRTSFSGNVGWRVSDALKLRLFLSWINNNQRFAGALTRAEFKANPRQADPSYVAGDHQLDVTTGRAALKGRWTINAASWLEFGVSYEGQGLYHPIVTSPFFTLLVNTVERTTDALLRYHLKFGSHTLVSGINFAYTSNEGSNFQNKGGVRGPREDRVDQRSNNFTLFLLDRWSFAPRWTLVYGTQGVVTARAVRKFDATTPSVRDQQTTYASVNPRVGLLYALSKRSQLFANISRVYAAPNNFQLDNDVRNNNATLRPMRGTVYEVGTRGAAALSVFDNASWHWSLAAYHAQLRNEILSVGPPGNLKSTNYDRTTHDGLEALLGASIPLLTGANRVDPLVSVSWNHFTFAGDSAFGGNKLPYAPDYVVHGEVMWRNRALGLYAGPTFDWLGARYADMANTYSAKGYALVGLRAGIERDRWTLFVEARNLADTAYVNAVQVTTTAAAGDRLLNPGAPRSVFVGMRVNY